MHHLGRKVEHGSAQCLAVFGGGVEHDVAREAALQQQHLVERVYWMHAVGGHKVAVEYLPKGGVVVALVHFHSVVAATVYAIAAVAVPFQWSRLYDSRRDVACQQPCAACAEQRVEVFFGRMAVVYPRYGLINKGVETLRHKVFDQQVKQLHHSGGRCRGVSDESAVGKSAVAHQRLAVFVGREQGVDPAFQIEHERKVAETVGVIVHVVAVEEERSVLRCGHKGVPFCLVFRRISPYLKLFCSHFRLLFRPFASLGRAVSVRFRLDIREVIVEVANVIFLAEGFGSKHKAHSSRREIVESAPCVGVYK